MDGKKMAWVKGWEEDGRGREMGRRWGCLRDGSKEGGAEGWEGGGQGSSYVLVGFVYIAENLPPTSPLGLPALRPPCGLPFPCHGKGTASGPPAGIPPLPYLGTGSPEKRENFIPT